MQQNKKIIIILVICVLVGVLGLFVFKNNRESLLTVSQPSTQEQQTINLNPPTKEDADRRDQKKNEILDRERSIENQKPSSSGVKNPVKPVITYAGQYGSQIEVGAYVAGIFEDGGTCTAQFSNPGNESLVKKVQAVKSASSVDCPVIAVKTGEFATKGTWSVLVSYDSSSATGSSDARTFEVSK